MANDKRPKSNNTTAPHKNTNEPDLMEWTPATSARVTLDRKKKMDGINKRRLSSSSAIIGAQEEVELGSMSKDVAITQNPRIQFVKKVSQARLTNTSAPSRSRKSSTPAPAKAPIKLRLIAPRRPSTPEQVAAFEETMQSPTHSDEETESHVQQVESPPPVTSLDSEARYLLVMAEIEKKKEEYREAGMDPTPIGSMHLAGEGSLFNPLDWE